MKNSHINKETKACSSCGRLIEYRKKWEKNWHEIKYCSDECRRNKNKFDFREQILTILQKKGFNKTICQSDIIESSEDKINTTLLEHVRRSARLLALEGKIDIVQHNQIVDPTSFKGPIKLKLRKPDNL